MAQHLVYPSLLRLCFFVFVTFACFRKAVQASHVSAEEETKHFLTNSLGVSKLIDFNSGTIAYKDHVEKSCYLEKIVTNSLWEKSRTLIVYPRLLTIQQVQTFAGPIVSTFCFGWPSRILRQTTNLELRRKRSDPGTFARRIRGQTQSQYLNYGKNESEGKAEAESHQLGSKAVVYGSNGMGQAQSQSGPFSCADCYNQFDQNIRSGVFRGDGSMQPTGYDHFFQATRGGAIQFPGQIPQSPEIGGIQDRVSSIAGIQRPDQLTTPSLSGGAPSGEKNARQQGPDYIIQEPIGAGQPDQLVSPGLRDDLGTRAPSTRVNGKQPELPGTRFLQGGTGSRDGIGIPDGQHIPGQPSVIYPGLQIPQVPQPISPGTPGLIVRPSGEIGISSGQLIPGQQSPILPGQQVSLVQKPVSPRIDQGMFEIGQRIPGQIVRPSGEIGIPSGQLIPGQQSPIFTGQQVPLLQKPISPGAEQGMMEIGQRIPGQVVRPSGEIGIPSGQLIPGQQSPIFTGQQVPLLQKPISPGAEQGMMEIGQHIPGQVVRPSGEIGIPSGQFIPGQPSIISPGQQMPQLQISRLPGTQQGAAQSPFAPIQTTFQPGITGAQPGQITYYIPGKSVQQPQQVSEQSTVAQGPGYFESDQRPIIYGQHPVEITEQKPNITYQQRIPYQEPSTAKGSIAGQMSGLYESSVGQRGRFSGTFQGNYAHDGTYIGQYSLPGQVPTYRVPGSDTYAQQPGYIGTLSPGQLYFPPQIPQMSTTGFPVQGSQQGQNGQAIQLGQMGSELEILQGGRDDKMGQRGQIPGEAQIGQVGQITGTGRNGKIIPGSVIMDRGSQPYPQYPGQMPQIGQPIYQGSDYAIPIGAITHPAQGPLVTDTQKQILPDGQFYQVPGAGIGSTTLTHPTQGQLTPGSQLGPGGQRIFQRPGTAPTVTVTKQPGQVQLPSVSQVSQQYPLPTFGTSQPGLYQQPIQPGQQSSDQQLIYPGHGRAPGSLIPGQGGLYGPDGLLGSLGQALPTSDDGNSEAQTNVQRVNNETQASASSSGRFAGGTAQSQVSGSYSGEGSFSASAGSNDGLRGAQTQVSGNSAGTLSSSQGNGGKSKSQTQVELNADTGDTTASAQTGGLNHGTNTQVQSGIKGGMADAQANGPGSTSSQAQIGFMPYNADTDQEDPRNPHNGGASASAGSGTHAGKSQVQIGGKYAFGIKYTGQAQASSANSGFTAQEIALPTMKPISFNMKASKQEEKHPSVREINSAKILQIVTTTTPTMELDLKTSDYNDDYDDLQDEEEPFNAKNLLQQHQTRSIQGDVLDPVEGLERGEVINADSILKHGDVIQPGHYIPGSSGVKIPSGFRGRISEENIPESNLRNVIYASGVKTNRLKTPEEIGYGSGYTYQPSYAPVHFSFKSSKPKFVSVSRSETGSRNVLTGKKTPSMFYTQSSTCGFFTNSCFYSNGKKMCLPKPKANADGTPMLCKN